MTDDTNVENTQNEESAAVETTEAQNAEVETSTDGTPIQEQRKATDPKALAREYYEKRQKRKIEQSAAEYVEQQNKELQEQLDSGEIPTDEVMNDVLQEKDQQLREYQLKDLVAENPAYAPHKDAIAQAMHDQRYANLSLEEVANLVAAKSVMELQEQERKVHAVSTVQGSSARSANNEVDYRNMSGDELEKRISGASKRFQ